MKPDNDRKLRDGCDVQKPSKTAPKEEFAHYGASAALSLTSSNNCVQELSFTRPYRKRHNVPLRHTAHDTFQWTTYEETPSTARGPVLQHDLGLPSDALRRLEHVEN